MPYWVHPLYVRTYRRYVQDRENMQNTCTYLLRRHEVDLLILTDRCGSLKLTANVKTDSQQARRTQLLVGAAAASRGPYGQASNNTMSRTEYLRHVCIPVWDKSCASNFQSQVSRTFLANSTHHTTQPRRPKQAAASSSYIVPSFHRWADRGIASYRAPLNRFGQPPRTETAEKAGQRIAPA